MTPLFTSHRTLAVALALAWLTAGAAAATTEAETTALCTHEMLQNQGATELRDIDFNRIREVPFLFGNADFPDAKDLHFRCRVYQGRVTSVEYLVRDPAGMDQRAWVVLRPRGADVGGLELDETAKALPAPPEVTPHFERPPEPSN